MPLFLIGIDDTDNDTSPGTGQLARRLAAEASERGAINRGITRHQFLIDSRIPYTSHNSGACMGIDWPGHEDGLEFAMELIADWSAEGSDPGVCIAPANAVPQEVVDWGWRATREVLDIEEATTLATATGLRLRALGGTGQGIVGALGSVGLRAGGNEGRYLDLPGMRDLADRICLNDLTQIGILVQHDVTDDASAGARCHNEPGDLRSAWYMTLGWVRPRLVGGRAVLPVKWSREHDAWIPVDQKRSRPLE